MRVMEMIVFFASILTRSVSEDECFARRRTFRRRRLGDVAGRMLVRPGHSKTCGRAHLPRQGATVLADASG